MGLEAGGRVFFAQAVADEDGREIHDHHQQDEEQRGVHERQDDSRKCHGKYGIV